MIKNFVKEVKEKAQKLIFGAMMMINADLIFIHLEYFLS